MIKPAVTLAAAVALAASPAALARAPHHHAAKHASHHAARATDVVVSHHRATVPGRLVSVDQTAQTAVVSVGGGHSNRQLTLDLSAAKVVLHAPDSQSAAGTLADLKGGDIVLARLSVSGKAARADVKAGTPVPVGELVDRGQPPAPPANKPAPVPAATPPPPVTPPVFYPRFQGPVTGVSSNLVTVLVGDVGNQHSVTLDLTGVTVYDVATKSPEAVSAIQVGDVVQARSAVTAGVASSDVQAGTPVPVSAAYDLGQTPTAS